MPQRFGLTLIAATCAALANAGAARAEPLSAAQLQATAPGGEFRGFTATGRGFENHIWRFAPDGRVTAIANVKRSLGNSVVNQDFGDSGTWRLEGDRLCVEWQGLNRPYSGCYSVDGSPGTSQVRLTGPATWQGTLTR